MGCTECIPVKPFALSQDVRGQKLMQKLPLAEDNAQDILEQQEPMKVGEVVKVFASERVGTVVAVSAGDELDYYKLAFKDGLLPPEDWFSKDAVSFYLICPNQTENAIVPKKAAQLENSLEIALPVTEPERATDATGGKLSIDTATSTVASTNESPPRLDASALLSLGQAQSPFASGNISSVGEGAQSSLAFGAGQLSGPPTRAPSMCSSLGPSTQRLRQSRTPFQRTRNSSMCSVQGSAPPHPLPPLPPPETPPHGAEEARSETELSQLEEVLQKVCGRASQRSRMESDLERLRESQAAECWRIEGELEEARAQAAQKVRQEAELERLKMQTAESAKLQVGLKRVQEEAEAYKSKLASEMSSLKIKNEKSRAEHLRMVEEMQKRLEEERGIAKLTRERDQLQEREGNARAMQFLQGRVDEVGAGAHDLRELVDDLQQQLKEAEGQKVQTLQEQEKMRQDLDEAVKAQDALRKARDDSEQNLEKERQPKCFKMPRCFSVKRVQ